MASMPAHQACACCSGGGVVEPAAAGVGRGVAWGCRPSTRSMIQNGWPNHDGSVSNQWIGGMGTSVRCGQRAASRRAGAGRCRRGTPGGPTGRCGRPAARRRRRRRRAQVASKRIVSFDHPVAGGDRDLADRPGACTPATCVRSQRVERRRRARRGLVRGRPPSVRLGGDRRRRRRRRARRPRPRRSPARPAPRPCARPGGGPPPRRRRLPAEVGRRGEHRRGRRPRPAPATTAAGGVELLVGQQVVDRC